MDIDEIIEQNRAALLSKSQNKKYRSFGHIFWEDFSDNRKSLEIIRTITVAFPLIATIIMLIMAAVLCDGNCYICVSERTTGAPVGPISILFMLVPFAIYTVGNSNTTLILGDIVTLVINLITLEMYGRNDVITSTAYIIYIIFIYLMFRRPFLKWYKLNK